MNTSRQRGVPPLLIIGLAITLFLISGCEQTATKTQLQPEHLIPESERQPVPEFSATDFFNDNEIRFPVAREDGAITIYNFFSPG